MNAGSFSSKPSAWFKTKVFSLSLSLFSLILFSVLLIGCGSSGGGGSSNTNTPNGGNVTNDNNSNTSGSNSKELTSFTFNTGVIKDYEISGTDVDITIDYNSTDITPKVTHTGISYSPAGRINFAKLPKIYTITAEDETIKDYSVTIRRAFIVSDENTLTNAIDTINGEIVSPGLISYITILVENNISLTNNKTIPPAWANRHIRLENNSTTPDVTIGGLIVEGNDIVELVDVNIDVNIDEVIVPTIAAGWSHSLALDSNGKIWATGYNIQGQLGLGDNNDRDVFTPVTISNLASGTKIVSIVASGEHSLALDSSGKIWATGYNKYGELGLGDNDERDVFTPVTIANLPSGAKIVSISAGGIHSLALDSNGKIWATGENNIGQLGLGNTNSQSSFQPVTIASLAPTAKIVSIAAGYEHSLALDSDGKLWATGMNSYIYGCLGNENEFQPVTIANLTSGTKIVSIAINNEHSLALDSNGKLWATGDNRYGQLGFSYFYGYEIHSFQPITISGLSPNAKIISVSVGFGHSLALDSNGKIWVTGWNAYNQLGLGNNTDQSEFQPVTLGSIANANIISIVAGRANSFAFDSDGKLWATGLNGNGDLGLGDDITRNKFTPVSF
jgi:alpha-tubulin suppressor-like RCC1 family protein